MANDEVKLVEVLVQDGEGTLAQKLLTFPIEKMTTPEVHFAWSVLDLVEKVSSERKEGLRVRLFEDAEKLGKEKESGSFVLELEDGKVEKQKRQGKPVVKEGPLRKLLEAKGIPAARVFVTRTVEEFDDKAFKSLLDAGVLDEAEVKALFEPGKVTWALKVEKPEVLPRRLKGK